MISHGAAPWDELTRPLMPIWLVKLIGNLPNLPAFCELEQGCYAVVKQHTINPELLQVTITDKEVKTGNIIVLMPVNYPQ